MTDNEVTITKAEYRRLLAEEEQARRLRERGCCSSCMERQKLDRIRRYCEMLAGCPVKSVLTTDSMLFANGPAKLILEIIKGEIK